MRFPIGAMSVGDILDRGLRLLLSRLPLLFSISLIVQVPVLTLQLLIPMVQGAAGGGAVLVLMLLFLITILILTPIAQAVILYVVTQEYLDRPATLGQAFSFALTRFGALLGSVILAGLITFLGTLLCIIPGIYLGVLYAFVSQVVVLESLSGTDALSRSKHLVTGFWWRVFGVIFLIQFVLGMVSGLVGVLLAMVFPYQEMVRGPDLFPVAASFNYPRYAVHTIVGDLISVLFSAYLAVCTTLLYLDLRIRKEGFDLEMAAQNASQPSP
jgi:hypothetical protein